MRYLLLLLAIVILASCSPQRRLARLLDRYPLPTDTLVTYRDTTIYKDSIVYEHIPGEVVLDSILIPVEIDLPYMELKTASTFSEATAWILDNQLGLELIQYDTIIQFILDSVLVNRIDSVFVEVIREVPTLVNPKPFYKNGFFILAGILLISLILVFAFRGK